MLLHGLGANADLNWFTSSSALGRHPSSPDHRGPVGPGSGWPAAPTTWRPWPTRSTIERFIAVGYSMGGPMAELMWHRHRPEVDGPRAVRDRRTFGVTPPSGYVRPDAGRSVVPAWPRRSGGR